MGSDLKKAELSTCHSSRLELLLIQTVIEIVKSDRGDRKKGGNFEIIQVYLDIIVFQYHGSWQSSVQSVDHLGK